MASTHPSVRCRPRSQRWYFGSNHFLAASSEHANSVRVPGVNPYSSSAHSSDSSSLRVMELVFTPGIAGPVNCHSNTTYPLRR